MPDLDLDGILEDAENRRDDSVAELVRYVFRLRSEKRSWLVEEDRFREAIRAKAAWWDANRPDAPAFEVVDDFRRLIGDEDA